MSLRLAYVQTLFACSGVGGFEGGGAGGFAFLKNVLQKLKLKELFDFHHRLNFWSNSKLFLQKNYL